MSVEYDTAELNEEPPEQVIPERLIRKIIADKPRVTRYAIDWSREAGQAQASYAPMEADAMVSDSMAAAHHPSPMAHTIGAADDAMMAAADAALEAPPPHMHVNAATTPPPMAGEYAAKLMTDSSAAATNYGNALPRPDVGPAPHPIQGF